MKLGNTFALLAVLAASVDAENLRVRLITATGLRRRRRRRVRRCCHVVAGVGSCPADDFVFEILIVFSSTLSPLSSLGITVKQAARKLGRRRLGRSRRGQWQVWKVRQWQVR